MLPKEYPFIPLKNLVLFPDIVIPIFIGREKSVKAMKVAQKNNSIVAFCLQKAVVDNPSLEDIHKVGVLAKIIKASKVDEKTYKLLVTAVKKVKIIEMAEANGGYLKVFVDEITITEEHINKAESKKLQDIILEKLDEYFLLNKTLPADTIKEIIKQNDLGSLISNITHFLMLPIIDKQNILEIEGLLQKSVVLIELINRELDMLRVETRLHATVKDNIERSQKEFYLKEKIKAIKAELGDQAEFDEILDYQSRVESTKMSKEAEEKAKRELSKLKIVSSVSAEAGIIKSYLEWLIEMPWQDTQQKRYEVEGVRELLDNNHYGLKKLKERIVEFLAVYQLTDNVQSTILCLSGPSGVGKTSIAKSIAQVMGRPFVKISMGGMNDEAELRGHRRTYVGAMPGRIIQAIRNAKVRNPVILLDEIDKITKNYNSNPATVLLEALDKEQNKMFYDYYLEVPFDLSEVLFIATANSISEIPAPLLDRMEVIKIGGYDIKEKLVIAKKYLLPRVRNFHGLDDSRLALADEVLREIVLSYTREAGLREFERCLATLARKEVLGIISGKNEPLQDKNKLSEYLGVLANKDNCLPALPAIGITLGLAYTKSGGEVMPVEVSVFPGKGVLKLTGKMGEVMQESSQTALSFVRLIAKDIGLKKSFYERSDIHIHIPENAIPKDGPSAGVTIAVALISAFTRVAVRNDIALTGEITLYGRVLPVGGIKEKLLASERYNLKQVFVPTDNLDDVKEAREHMSVDMLITGFSKLTEVLNKVFVKPIYKNPKPFVGKAEFKKISLQKKEKKDANPQNNSPAVYSKEKKWL